MATHKLYTQYIVKFEDGTERELEIPDKVYFFYEQKPNYLVMWMEYLIKKYDIKSKPISIKEVCTVQECEPYQIIIGV